MRIKTLMSAGLLVVAAGCGDDGGGGSYGDPIENPQAEMAGTQSVSGANEMTVLASDPGNDGAIGQMFTVYGTLSQMASYKQGAQPTSARDVGGNANLDEACLSTSGSTTTYDNCVSGDTTIDGTITGGDARVEMDLAITTSQAVIDMSGALDFTATSLDGRLTYETSVQAGGMDIVTTYTGDYNITMDGQGCPTAGDVEVHYTASGGAIDVYAKAEFGPTCGDVTFY